MKQVHLIWCHDDLMNNYTKKTIKLLLFSILWCNLFNFIMQMRLYCSNQLETTLHEFCDHMFKPPQKK